MKTNVNSAPQQSVASGKPSDLHSAAIRATDEHAKLILLPAPELSAEERAVVDAFIRAKRREARAKKMAGELRRTVLAILRARKQVERKGAVLSLKKRYDYQYSAAVELLQGNLALACAMERESGTAKAEVTETVAFEDVSAKEAKN